LLLHLLIKKDKDITHGLIIMELILIIKLLFHLIMEKIQINVELLPNILNLVNSELIAISIK